VIVAVVTGTGACADEGESRLRVYRVESGDTVSSIAARFSVAAGEIARLNELDDADSIRAGGGLLLPDADATRALPVFRPPQYRDDAPAACELSRYGDPDPYDRVERWGCWTTDCLSVGDGRRVCKCASDGGGRILVERTDSAVTLRWPGAGFMGDTRNFEVLEGDLDRDGRDELIVASHRYTSNGMAVMRWDLAILDGGDLDAAPVTFTVEGFGPHSFGVDAASGTCDVQASEWVEAGDPLLGAGNYFVSRAYRYHPGALEPRDAPVTAERLREGARAELRDEDPFVPERTTSVRWGTVRRVHRLAGEDRSFALELDVELASGARVTFRPGDTYDVGGPDTYARIGDAATRRVYPEGYAPRDHESLEGRGVRIEGFDDAGGDHEWHVVWLD
jgi:hypothetical protein